MAKMKSDTLLRKIQKGTNNFANSFKSGVSERFSRFNFNENGRISLFRKREIVEPYLHPIDSAIVNNQVSTSAIRDLKITDQNIDKQKFEKFLPTHLVNDLYSLYYNPSQRMKFSKENITNKVKFKILDSINNSLIKIVTNNSHIGSYVYTEEISKFLYKKFMELPPEEQEKLKNALQNCNQGPDGDEDEDEGQQKGSKRGSKSGDGDEEGEYIPKDQDLDNHGNQGAKGDEKSQRHGDDNYRGAANNSSGKNTKKDMSQEAADQMDRDLKKMVDLLNSNQAKKELDQAFKKAEQKLEELKQIGVEFQNDEEMPEEEKREIIRNLNNLGSIKQSLSRLNTSKDKILKAVQKILNGTTNYFSQKCITNDVELFEADQILDINGIELLHPFFKNSRILDLSITERKYIGKFDLYVDCSGSMSSGCGGNLSNVPRIDLAKALAMQMKQLGILGDLYEFEDRPKKIMNTDMSILMMAARGGTDIEKVLQNILKTGNNSVILSDGESMINTYTHKAFFIGVGTDFYYFKHYEGPGRKFVEEAQCVYYNGTDFETAQLMTPNRR